MKKTVEIAPFITFSYEQEENTMFDMVLALLVKDGKFDENSARAVARQQDWTYLGIEVTEDITFTRFGHPANPDELGSDQADVTLITLHPYAKHNGKGEVVTCLVQRAKVVISGDKVTTSRWYHKINLVINETPNGLRYFISANKKIFWGGWRIHEACLSAGLRNNTLEWRVNYLLKSYLEEKYKIEQFYSELQYYDGSMSMEDICNPFIVKYLTNRKGVKDILNGIYSHKGEKFLAKSTFGGIGNIRDFNTLLNAMFTIRALRGFNPDFLAKMPNPIWFGGNISTRLADAATIDQFFRTFGVNAKMYEMLLIDTEIDNPYADAQYRLRLAKDTLTMFKGIKARRLQHAIKAHLKGHKMTLEELHDYVNAEYQKVLQENRIINIPELTKFEGVVSSEIICVAPKCTHDLVQWGAEYNICIGSYSERVFNGDTYCVGFQKPDGSFWGFAEINKARSLTQLLGKHNLHLEDAPRKAIEAYLRNKGVHVSQSYWGARF